MRILEREARLVEGQEGSQRETRRGNQKRGKSQRAPREIISKEAGGGERASETEHNAVRLLQKP